MQRGLSRPVDGAVVGRRPRTPAGVLAAAGLHDVAKEDVVDGEGGI